MVDLNGSLTGVGLLSVVQLIGELHHTGTLYLTKAGAASRLAFVEGRLVAAECGRERGLQAVAESALDFAGADFHFEPGPTTLERTLDLGPADLTRLLTRIESGGFSLDGPPDEPSGAPTTAACAFLGFADDSDHHYSRSTAMHRCYASGAPSLISAEQQRELCLSGRFAACPRFRNTAATVPPAAAVAEVEPPPPPAQLRAVPPRPAQRPIPPGVAARMAAAAQMQISPGPAAAPLPDPVEPVAVPPPVSPPRPPQAPLPPRTNADEQQDPFYRRRRGLTILAAGAALGLVLVLLAGLFALPTLRSSLAQQQQPAPPSAAATQPGAASPVSVAGARVTAGPVQGQALAAAARPGGQASPAAAATSPRAGAGISAPRQGVTAPPSSADGAARPDATAASGDGVPRQAAAASAASGDGVPRQAAASAAPGDSNALMDVRFASGPAPRWLTNPPYASWGDGAYRLLAKDATRFVAVGVPLDQVLDNFIVSATLRKTGGPPGGGYGLIVRDQGPEPRDGENQELNAYVLETGDLGEYGVWRRDGDHWVDLVPWTRSPAVRAGGSPNELLVRASGNQLTFSVNGSVIASVTDDTYAQGGVGLFVGGDYNDVALDRFDIQRLD